MMYFYFICLVILSYFIGNISFAILISKKKNNDIRNLGSGNPGSMNMLRNFGFKIGMLTLVLDAIKGAIPALIGFYLTKFLGYDATLGLYMAGLAVVIGHIYPITRKFKGGKGVACALGVYMVANPLLTLLFFVIAFFYLLFFDYGAIASFIVITSMTVIEATQNTGSLIVSLLIFTMFCVVFFAHGKNFTRMLVGTENNANLKKSLTKLFKKNQNHSK